MKSSTHDRSLVKLFGAVIVLTAALLALGSLAVHQLRERLPERVVTHWGPGGEPDGWSSITAALWMTIGVTAGMVAVLLVVGAAVPTPLKPSFAALAGALAVFVSCFSFATTLLQVWLDPRQIGDGPVIVGLIVGGLALSALTALVLHRWGSPARPPLPEAEPALTTAPRVVLAEGVQASFVERVGLSPALVGVMSVSIAVPLLLAGWLDWWMLALVILILVPVVLFASATVRVDEHGLLVRGGSVVTLMHEPLERISSAEVGTVAALAEFGGWGWRLGADGRRAFVTRSGPALIVHRHGEADLVVSVQRPLDAAGLINSLKDRASRVSPSM